MATSASLGGSAGGSIFGIWDRLRDRLAQAAKAGTADEDVAPVADDVPRARPRIVFDVRGWPTVKVEIRNVGDATAYDVRPHAILGLEHPALDYISTDEPTAEIRAWSPGDLARGESSFSEFEADIGETALEQLAEYATGRAGELAVYASVWYAHDPGAAEWSRSVFRFRMAALSSEIFSQTWRREWERTVTNP